MENNSNIDMLALLESIIADENSSPEKRKWAEVLLQSFQVLMAEQEHLIEYMKLINECDPIHREPLMIERNNLFYQIAYQYFTLLSIVNPENESIYRNEYESAVKEYKREYGLNRE